VGALVRGAAEGADAVNIIRDWNVDDFRGVDLDWFARRYARAPDRPFVRTLMLMAIMFQVQRRRLPVHRVLAWLGPPEWFLGDLRFGHLFYRLRTPPPALPNTPHCLVVPYLNGWVEQGGTNALTFFRAGFRPTVASLPQARRILAQVARTRPNARIVARRISRSAR
jgi:hypothetical protein